jgi:hypothetical protein
VLGPIQRFNGSTIHAAKAIVVKSVAKSLLIFIKSGDMVFERGFYPDTNDGSSTSKVVASFTSELDRIFLVTIEVLICGRCEHPG